MARDIVGDYEEVGADPDDLLRAIVSGIDDIEGEVGYDGREIVSGRDIVGAIQQAAARKLRMRNKGSQAQRPTHFNGKQLDPTKWRRLPAPMPATSIAAATTQDITIKPQKLFRAEFLVAAESTAGKLFVSGITVQGENQLVTAGEIPLSAFYGSVLLNNELQLKTADIGAEITLKVRNSDTAAVTFSGTFFGEAYVD